MAGYQRQISTDKLSTQQNPMQAGVSTDPLGKRQRVLEADLPARIPLISKSASAERGFTSTTDQNPKANISCWTVDAWEKLREPSPFQPARNAAERRSALASASRESQAGSSRFDALGAHGTPPHCPASGPAAQPQVRVASTDPLTRARALVAAVAAEVAAAGAAAEAAAILAATLGPDGRLQIH